MQPSHCADFSSQFAVKYYHPLSDAMRTYSPSGQIRSIEYASCDRTGPSLVRTKRSAQRDVRFRPRITAAAWHFRRTSNFWRSAGKMRIILCCRSRAVEWNGINRVMLILHLADVSSSWALIIKFGVENLRNFWNYNSILPHIPKICILLLRPPCHDAVGICWSHILLSPRALSANKKRTCSVTR